MQLWRSPLRADHWHYAEWHRAERGTLLRYMGEVPGFATSSNMHYVVQRGSNQPHGVPRGKAAVMRNEKRETISIDVD